MENIQKLSSNCRQIKSQCRTCTGRNISHTVCQHTESHSSEFASNGFVRIQSLMFSQKVVSKEKRGTNRQQQEALSHPEPVPLGRKRDGRGTRHTKDTGECFASLEWKHKVLTDLFSKTLMSWISHMHSLRVIMLSAMFQLTVLSRKNQQCPQRASKELFNTTIPLSDKQNTRSVLVRNGEDSPYWMLEKKHRTLKGCEGFICLYLNPA